MIMAEFGRTFGTAIASMVLASGTAAQNGGTPPAPPKPHAIGKVERVSTDVLASAATALAMPGGKVLVNDLTGRRLLLFDSTLAHAVVVADTTSATSNAYGAR